VNVKEIGAGRIRSLADSKQATKCEDKSEGAQHHNDPADHDPGRRVARGHGEMFHDRTFRELILPILAPSVGDENALELSAEKVQWVLEGAMSGAYDRSPDPNPSCPTAQTADRHFARRRIIH
jgi:hypothetical protein